MRELKRVVVVGAGTMGSQIALQTALSGRYDVTLVDSVAAQLDKAAAQNKKLVDRSVEKGRLTADAANAAVERIKPSGDLASVAKEAFAESKRLIRSTAAERAEKGRKEDARHWIDLWFSPGARRRIEDVVVRLKG